jgi:hypothetical protein
VVDKPVKAKPSKEKSFSKTDGDKAYKAPYAKADKAYGSKTDKPSDKPYVKKWDKAGADAPRADSKSEWPERRPKSGGDLKSSGYVARAPFPGPATERTDRSGDDKPRTFLKNDGVKRNFEARVYEKPAGEKREGSKSGYASKSGKSGGKPAHSSGYVARDAKPSSGGAKPGASKYAVKKKQRPPAASTG